VTPSGPVVWHKTVSSFERKLIEVGKRNHEEVEVRSGLSAGDLVSRTDMGQSQVALGGSALR